jgi:hypothetical protein
VPDLHPVFTSLHFGNFFFIEEGHEPCLQPPPTPTWRTRSLYTYLPPGKYDRNVWDLCSEDHGLNLRVGQWLIFFMSFFTLSRRMYGILALNGISGPFPSLSQIFTNINNFYVSFGATS